jgi:hypothetical protein
MNRIALTALACMLLAAGARGADAPAAGSTRVYDFVASLDGKPIGRHRFTVTTRGDGARKVVSEADFQVRVLGFLAYRYHHRAEEQWQGDCLVGLRATTDDDGKPASVQLAREGDAATLRANGATSTVEGCLMTYAYWNPALRDQKRLLNPQTGKVDAVTVEQVADGPVRVGGRDVAASDWRVAGGEAPVDVWVTAQGDWIGLDSVVAKGKHKLSYRLP